jgi:hypothetical protein
MRHHEEFGRHGDLAPKFCANLLDSCYVLVCRCFKVTATAAGSCLGWHSAAVHMFRIYWFRWPNFVSCFGVRLS